MQTAFELVRLLAQRRPVALAVERFSHTMQPQLDSLPALPSDEARLAVLKTLFQIDDYQRVWGTRVGSLRLSDQLAVAAGLRGDGEVGRAGGLCRCLGWM